MFINNTHTDFIWPQSHLFFLCASWQRLRGRKALAIQRHLPGSRGNCPLKGRIFVVEEIFAVRSKEPTAITRSQRRH